eukprot:512788-Prymnesium_polylepis.1
MVTILLVSSCSSVRPSPPRMVTDERPSLHACVWGGQLVGPVHRAFHSVAFSAPQPKHREQFVLVDGRDRESPLWMSTSQELADRLAADAQASDVELVESDQRGGDPALFDDLTNS